MALRFPAVRTIGQALEAGALRLAGWLMAGGPASTFQRLDVLQTRYPNLFPYQVAGVLARVEQAWQAGQATMAGQAITWEDVPRGAVIPEGQRYAYEVTYEITGRYRSQAGRLEDFRSSGQETIYAPRLLSRAELALEAERIALDRLRQDRVSPPQPTPEGIPEVDFWVGGVIRR